MPLESAGRLLWVARLLWWRPPCVLRMVIVNLKSDTDVALRGLLWRYRGGWFVLKDAQLLQATGAATKLDGEQVIDRSNVAFIQVLP